MSSFTFSWLGCIAVAAVCCLQRILINPGCLLNYWRHWSWQHSNLVIIIISTTTTTTTTTTTSKTYSSTSSHNAWPHPQLSCCYKAFRTGLCQGRTW
jgi:hypothetical protein